MTRILAITAAATMFLGAQAFADTAPAGGTNSGGGMMHNAMGAGAYNCANAMAGHMAGGSMMSGQMSGQMSNHMSGGQMSGGMMSGNQMASNQMGSHMSGGMMSGGTTGCTQPNTKTDTKTGGH